MLSFFLLSKSKWLVGLKLKHVERLLVSGDLEKAEQVCRRLLVRFPNHVEVLSQLAWIATDRKQWGDAVSHWERVLSVCESTGQAVPNQAVGSLSKACLLRARELREVGDNDGALSVLSVLLSQKPNHVETLLEMAEVYSLSEEWYQSLLVFRKLQKIERRRISRELHGMTVALKACGKIDLAKAVAKGTGLCGLGNSEMLLELLDDFAQDERWSEASEMLFSVLAINPCEIANIQVSRLVLRSFQKTGQEQEALRMLRDGISLAEEQAASFTQLAILHELERALQSNAIEVKDVSSQYYDDIYRASPKYKDSGTDSTYFPVWKEVLSLIKAKGYHKILDIGCGPGQFAEYLIKEEPTINYTGIDFSRVAIQTAKKRCPSASFIQTDASATEILGNSEFDVVLIMEVLEHMHGDIDLLKKLPSGTHIIATVPNFDSFGHVRFFSGCDEVRQRYEVLISNANVMAITLSGHSKLFLLYGIITH